MAAAPVAAPKRLGALTAGAEAQNRLDVVEEPNRLGVVEDPNRLVEVAAGAAPKSPAVGVALDAPAAGVLDPHWKSDPELGDAPKVELEVVAPKPEDGAEKLNKGALLADEVAVALPKLNIDVSVKQKRRRSIQVVGRITRSLLLLYSLDDQRMIALPKTVGAMG